MRNKIVVGLSGGVDSSMSLFLLQKQGWDCIGVHLNMPKWMGKKPLAQTRAKKVCQKLKIAFYTLNIKKEFEKKIVSYFIKEYKAGRTPNPCIVCNPELKFKTLLNFAKKKKIDYVATGHWVKIKKLKTFKLIKAKDKTKDQTYYLSFLTQKKLKHIVFPLKNYAKTQIKKMAKKEKMGFLSKQKESQDFCYCPSKNIVQLLEKKIGKRKGQIIDTKGNILGQHQGLHFYTIGQRKRIGLSGGPYFVLKLDSKNNQVVVTKNEKDLLQKEILLSPFNFISGKLSKKPIKIKAKIRYGHKEQPATLYPPKENKLKLIFNKPQRAVTPGQFAVFYRKNICLGGGKILPS
jgi:tRNA-specific 2-thiouridylase